MVKSPYNFVPAPTESEVFIPKWADQISHDIPFEDGESGEIEVKITAQTPIFIRNGHSKGDGEVFDKWKKGELPNPSSDEQAALDRYLNFSNNNGEYFIPATSIKGMLRNVLEIMSFSRMKRVDDDRYAFRDLTRDSLYMQSYKSQDVKAGWLIQTKKGGWQIEECESMAFISHIELAKQPFNMSFRRDFLNNKPNDKSAKHKYNRIGNRSLKSTFKVSSGPYNKYFAEYDSIGVEGILVFTGQSSSRNEQGTRASGKINEFVFFDSSAPSTIELTDKQIKDFKFIYLDHDKNNISTDWEFWKTRLQRDERVPIFYSKDNTGNVKHFGLAYMYKLPFQNSIHQMQPISGYNKLKLDLVELIFGNTQNQEALKGRVSISNAFSKNAKPSSIKTEILGSPKASYFPFYLKQYKKELHNGDKEYFTYQDNASLKGYKRYPIQNSPPIESFENRYTEKQRQNFDVFTKFIPLESGAEFSFKIRFHNLKKSEIGAVLSALSFHGYNNTYFHSLGGGKPLGYGKIKVEDIILKELKFDFWEYLIAFEELITFDKMNSENIKKLLLMSSANENLTYPSLEKFVEIKTEKEIIWDYDSTNIQFKSASKRLEIERNREQFSSNYDLSHIANFKSLRNQIKTDFEDIVPDNVKQSIYECIINIFDEKETKKTFKEKTFNDNPWQLPIAIWLSQEKAKELYDKLQNN